MIVEGSFGEKNEKNGENCEGMEGNSQSSHIRRKHNEHVEVLVSNWAPIAKCQKICCFDSPN